MTADAIAPQRQAARDCRCRWASAAVWTGGTIVHLYGSTALAADPSG